MCLLIKDIFAINSFYIYRNSNNISLSYLPIPRTNARVFFLYRVTYIKHNYTTVLKETDIRFARITAMTENQIFFLCYFPLFAICTLVYSFLIILKQILVVVQIPFQNTPCPSVTKYTIMKTNVCAHLQSIFMNDFSELFILLMLLIFHANAHINIHGYTTYPHIWAGVNATQNSRVGFI